jgi:hypothetical protein
MADELWDVKGSEGGPAPTVSTHLALGIVILTLSYGEYRQQRCTEGTNTDDFYGYVNMLRRNWQW